MIVFENDLGRDFAIDDLGEERGHGGKLPHLGRLAMVNPATLWESERLGDRLLLALLTPASWLYGLGWECYLGMYRLGFKKATEPHFPVVVIGNLVVGGSGKTPVTCYLAELIGRERQVVIGCNGYGSPMVEGANLAPEGPLDPKIWGDEPAMLRWLLPSVPIIVGRKRALAAGLAAKHFPEAVLLMDDGFQHLPVKHHFSIILNPEGLRNRRCLPAGPYREPRFELRRADLVLGQKFKVVKEPLSFEKAVSGEAVKLEEAHVLCALGRPQNFVADLEASGVDLHERRLLPDHDALDGAELFADLGDEPIVVTAKDWIKLRERKDKALDQIVVARQRVRVEPEAEFLELVKAKICGSRKD